MADANGQRFWLLSEQSDWIAASSASGHPAPEYDDQRRTYRLGRFADVAFTETPGDASARRDLSPTVMDEHGTFAFVDPGSGDVHGTGSVPGSVAIHTPTVAPADMAVSPDGVLFLIEGNEVVLVDLRERWTTVRLDDAGLAPVRIAVADDGTAWVLDGTNRGLARVHGRPLPERGLRVRGPDVFDPHEENPNPPRLEVMPNVFDGAETPVDVAISDAGRIAVLLWRGADEALVRFVEDGAVSAAHVLLQVARPYSLRWLDDDTLAVVVASEVVPDGGGAPVPSSDVVTYLADLSDTDVMRPPLGGVYPLPGHDLAPLVRTTASPPFFAVRPDVDPDRRPRKLTRVSAIARAPGGRLGVPDGAPLDSGQVGFVWHRAYIEAHLPISTGVRMMVAASDDLGVPADEAFFEHVFGDVAAERGLPRGVWSTQPSELPFHRGLLPCPAEPHRSGLFSVLLQRNDRRVSALSGRYLWMRLMLEGNGGATPEIAAVRVYGSRFSYVQNYLPRVFHEQLVSPEADQLLAEGPRSQADFLERFLCNFEGVLTPLEDRVANAHLLTDPGSAPDEALDWLGSWIGFVFDSAYPAEYRREALRNTMLLHRWRGTTCGLELALEILTGGRIDARLLERPAVDEPDIQSSREVAPPNRTPWRRAMAGGAVSRGQIVLLEGWRLRRTFTTLLGVDLSHRDDPLLAGVAQSGNSIVGDALILGEPERLEFLALLRRAFPGDGPPPDATVGEWIGWYIEDYLDERFVEPFLDQLAHRLVVLVHEDLGRDLVGLVQRVAALEAPAHLETDVSHATYPFMVGLASLVGVDSYLRPPPPKAAIVVDESRLGARGFLSRPAALDPRLEGGVS